jgi:two-component system nitrate/nitrite response regulator NarL
LERQTAVLIVDPVELFREGLRRLLFEAGFQPVWCSERPPVGPVADLGSQSRPLVIIGTELEEAIVQIAEVKRLYQSSRSVLLLDVSSARHFVMAFHSGAYACLPRGTSCEMLLHALKLVMDGSAVVPSDLLTLLLSPAQSQPLVSVATARQSPSLLGPIAARYGLSARELTVVPRLREGLSNKEIARELGITEATVKVHVKALLRKASVKNRTQLALWATGMALPCPDELASVKA